MVHEHPAIARPVIVRQGGAGARGQAAYLTAGVFNTARGRRSAPLQPVKKARSPSSSLATICCR